MPAAGPHTTGAVHRATGRMHYSRAARIYECTEGLRVDMAVLVCPKYTAMHRTSLASKRRKECFAKACGLCVRATAISVLGRQDPISRAALRLGRRSPGFLSLRPGGTCHHTTHPQARHHTTTIPPSYNPNLIDSATLPSYSLSLAASPEECPSFAGRGMLLKPATRQRCNSLQ